MDMRCETCVHWRNGEYDRIEITSLRRCQKAVEYWEATTWNDDYERVLAENYKDQKMFVNDGSSYRADLYTAADFFCAHHEAAG